MTLPRRRAKEAESTAPFKSEVSEISVEIAALFVESPRNEDLGSRFGFFPIPF